MYLLCNIRSNKIISAVGLIFFLTVFFRAWTQSFTIDEATTFLFYTSSLSPDYWLAGSNNHLLSSILIYVSISIFGFSPLAMRLPSVIGCLIFTIAAARLVNILTRNRDSVGRICIYLVLIFNPFIVDYLVPARGYSLAMACQMLVIAIIASKICTNYICIFNRRRAVLIATVAAMSVEFNYSFLFSASATIFCYFIVSVHSLYLHRALTWRGTFGIFIYLFAPFVGNIAFLCGNNILSMPKSEIEIGWGTNSLLKTFESFSRLSFNMNNPFITPPASRPTFQILYSHITFIFFVLLFLTIFYMTLRAIYILKMRNKSLDLRKDTFVWFLASVFGLSLLMHLTIFYFFRIKLPYTRTGIHFMPYITLFIASPLFLTRFRTKAIDRFIEIMSLTLTSLIALNFIFSQHFSYFQEWKWDADACSATDVALDYGEILHTEDIRLSWEFDAVSNYYAQLFGEKANYFRNIPEPKLLEENISNAPTVFIVSERVWNNIMGSGLIPVYESRLSGTIVAVRHPGKAYIPTMPVRFHSNMKARCYEHGWFADGNRYPGTIDY